MNQKIQELKERAMVDRQGHGAFGEPEFYKELDVDKFAELIVLECVRVAKSTDADDGDDYKSGRTWAGMDILKHFGVE